jgi:chemotaxis methyl-accepting protein methylase
MKVFAQNSSPATDDDRFRHIRFFDTPSTARTPHSRAPRIASPSQRQLPLPTLATAPSELDFLAWVLRQGGVTPDAYRPEPLLRRLGACLRALRCASVAEARDRLQREPQRLNVALNALLIGVTQFYRDPELFVHLAALLPLLATDRAGCRVWSACCSDGSEVYSLAILWAELGRLPHSEVLGTDCREHAVACAEEGWFSPPQLHGLSDDLKAKYFVEHRGRWRVCDTVRRSIRWNRLDLLGSDDIPAGWDVICCRNLAIYLCPAAAERMWSRLVQALRPRGLLIVGKAERPATNHGLARLAPCIYQKLE